VLLVVAQGLVVGLHGAGEFQVRERVFMRAAHARGAGQRCKLVERGEHLRRRALEQPPAAAGKQGVAAKQQRPALDFGGEKRNMPRRVAGYVEHRQAQAQHLDGAALLQAHERLGDGFARGAIDLRPGGVAQGSHTADMVGVVVRD